MEKLSLKKRTSEQKGFHLNRYISELENEVRVQRQNIKDMEETIKRLQEARKRLLEILDQKEMTQ